MWWETFLGCFCPDLASDVDGFIRASRRWPLTDILESVSPCSHEPASATGLLARLLPPSCHSARDTCITGTPVNQGAAPMAGEGECQVPGNLQGWPDQSIFDNWAKLHDSSSVDPGKRSFVRKSEHEATRVIEKAFPICSFTCCGRLALAPATRQQRKAPSRHIHDRPVVGYVCGCGQHRCHFRSLELLLHAGVPLAFHAVLTACSAARSPSAVAAMFWTAYCAVLCLLRLCEHWLGMDPHVQQCRIWTCAIMVGVLPFARQAF